MLHLERTNEVLDDYQGNIGKVNYLTGAYFSKEGSPGLVPYAYWYRGGARALCDRDDPRNVDLDIGCRGAVRVG